MAGIQADHDRVVMASRKPDGTPDQTPDFEFIGDPEMVLEANTEQLKVQAVSAADANARGQNDGSSDEEGPEDPTIAKLQDVHADAEKAAEAQAKTEVKAKHADDAGAKAAAKAADK